MEESDEDDPLMPLLMEAMSRLLDLNGKWPITWVIGEEWVVFYGMGQWTIGPDDPATEDQVRELLVRASGQFDLQPDYQSS